MTKKIIIFILLLFLIGCGLVTSEKPRPKKDSYSPEYVFSDRGCVIVKGSDSLLGVRFLLLEGYCIELNSCIDLNKEEEKIE